MKNIVGVRFRTAGKIYYFDPLAFELHRDSHVIVETARGIEYGTVVGDIRQMEEEAIPQPLKPIIRVATPEDDTQNEANKQKEKEAYRTCQIKIALHNLDMKLIDCEYTFDNNKILFYFTSDGRVDFRELVKDLASEFHTRIELRQVGVRDETKMLGGYGSCGRVLCCHGHLSDFIPVSIKMAKEQGLSLNPTKISGVCGRLMCCLKHEQETYEELNKRLPRVGDFVTAEDGTKGVVHSISVLREIVHVMVESGGSKEIKDYPAGSLTYKRGMKQPEVKEEIDEEALAALMDKPGDVASEEAPSERSKEHNQKGGRNNYKEHRKDFHKEFNREEDKEHSQGGRKEHNKNDRNGGKNHKFGGKNNHKEHFENAHENQEHSHDVNREVNRSHHNGHRPAHKNHGRGNHNGASQGE